MLYCICGWCRNKGCARWHPLKVERGESIGVVGKKGTYKFSASVSGTSSSATFSHVGEGTFNENEVIAVYPYASGNYSGNFDDMCVSNVTVPSNQTAVVGSYDPAAAIAVAHSTNTTLEFKNATALLQFSVAIAGVSFIARINGYLSKQAASNKTFTVNQIAPIGELPAPEKFGWGLVGQHQGWNITLPTPMYKVSDKAYGVLNIKLQSNGFKFAKNGLSNWNTNNTYFGAWKNSGSGYFNYSTEMGVGAWYGVYTNNLGGQSENIGVSDFNKSYDVYVKILQDADWGQELGYTVVEHGTKVTF